jgi:hypothetical protein
MLLGVIDQLRWSIHFDLDYAWQDPKVKTHPGLTSHSAVQLRRDEEH